MDSLRQFWRAGNQQQADKYLTDISNNKLAFFVGQTVIARKKKFVRRLAIITSRNRDTGNFRRLPFCSEISFLLTNYPWNFYNVPTVLLLLPLAALFSIMSSKLAVWISSFTVTFRYLSLRLQCLLKGCTGWQCFGSEDEMHPGTEFWISITSWPILTICTLFSPSLPSRRETFSYPNISFGHNIA